MTKTEEIKLGRDHIYYRKSIPLMRNLPNETDAEIFSNSYSLYLSDFDWTSTLVFTIGHEK